MYLHSIYRKRLQQKEKHYFKYNLKLNMFTICMYVCAKKNT